MDSKLPAIFLLYLVTVGICDHLIMGDGQGKSIIHHSFEQYNTIPFARRVKDFFFNDPTQRNITAIIAYDNLHSKAFAYITAGGVGFTYVNIRMTSERGRGLDYDIGIYS